MGRQEESKFFYLLIFFIYDKLIDKKEGLLGINTTNYA
jgi:hypothetical protein